MGAGATPPLAGVGRSPRPWPCYDPCFCF